MTHHRKPVLGRLIVTALATSLIAFAAPGLAHAAGEAHRGDRVKPFVPQNLLDAAAANKKQVFHVIVTGVSGKTGHALENEVLRENGKLAGDVTRTFGVIDALAVDLEGHQITWFAKKTNIRSIVPDAPVVASSFDPAELWPSVVGVDRLWETHNANGTTTPGPQAPAIAIIDSGVDASRVADFGGRLRPEVDFTGTPGGDANGHGTMVAGIAAGSAHSYPGAAPNAPIVPLRVVGADGSARTSDVIAAVDWVYRNRIAQGIGVVNLSLHSGNPAYAFEDPLARAARKLWLTGTVVVAAAGNEGPQRMVYAPASDPFVISVGAVGTNDTLTTADDTAAPWSSTGYTAEGFAKPELSAPGRYMVGPLVAGSTIAQNFADRIVAPGYVWMSGTSFAAPVVAGVAAQLLARHPSWTPDQVKGALMLSAHSLPGAQGFSAGVGEIDAVAANAVTSPPNPNAALDAFVVPDPTTGTPTFDSTGWKNAVATDASWVSASWVSASWVSASWVSASWVSASWVSSAQTDASWVSASWVSSSSAAASWVSANGKE